MVQHFLRDEYTATDDGNPVNFPTGFHTYAVEWDETLLRTQMKSASTSTIICITRSTRTLDVDANFTTAKNIILNLAVGGDFGGDPNGTTILPQTMLVDYVRVWQRKSVSGDYNGDGLVDAADYIVWRESGPKRHRAARRRLRQRHRRPVRLRHVAHLRARAPPPAGAAASIIMAVPEPAMGVPMAISIMLVLGQRQRPPISK